MSRKHLAPIPPGEILLEEFMKPLRISMNRLARDIDVPPNRISAIVHGKRAITRFASANTSLSPQRSGWTCNPIMSSEYFAALPGS
jgi:hypothetical protein